MPKVAMTVTFDKKELDAAIETAAKAVIGKSPPGSIHVWYELEPDKSLVAGAAVEFCGIGNRADKA